MSISEHGLRASYLAEDGFVLFTDANNRLMDFMRDLRPPEPVTVPYASVGPEDEILPYRPPGNVAAAGLFYSARRLQGQLLEVVRGSEGSGTCEAFFRQFDISNSEQRTADRYCHDRGFDDPDFTWYFAPLIANVVVKQTVAEGFMATSAYEQMTLSDWASIMRSPWFSSLMQQMAIAKFGAYGTMGKQWYTWGNDFVDDVASHAIHQGYPPISDQKPFCIAPEQPSAPAKALLTPTFKRQLRAGMDRGQMSVLNISGVTRGCPIARYAGTLPDRVTENPHMRRLVERGELTMNPSKQLGRIAFRQERTAIDVALDVLADRLVLYEETYGTPYVSYDEQAQVHVEHRKNRRTIGQRTSKIFARFVQ